MTEQEQAKKRVEMKRALRQFLQVTPVSINIMTDDGLDLRLPNITTEAVIEAVNEYLKNKS